MFYTSKDITYIPNGSIVEWDIQSGNTSIMKHFDLIPKKMILKFEKMPKAQRVVAVGQYQRAHPEIRKPLEAGFNTIVKEFKEVNELTNSDVISIKRDAVFINERTPKITQFGDDVVFVNKNFYQSYMLLNGIECYMKPNGEFDLKGIADEFILYHINGILELLRDCFDLAGDFERLNQYLKEYVDAYKKRELGLDHYREFNQKSGFPLMSGEYTSYQMDITEEELEKTNIGYNYLNIILPLIRIVLS